MNEELVKLNMIVYGRWSTLMYFGNSLYGFWNGDGVATHMDHFRAYDANKVVYP